MPRPNPLRGKRSPWSRRCFGEEHPNTATCLATLAGLLAFQEKHAEAESMYLEALAIRKKAFGEEHAIIALNLNDLAILLRRRERYEEAESLYREGSGHAGEDPRRGPSRRRPLPARPGHVLIDQGEPRRRNRSCAAAWRSGERHFPKAMC